MKTIPTSRVLVPCVLALCLLFPLAALSAPEPRDGDVIFQQSVSFQSKALQIATHSPYTHCGLVLFKDGKPYVFEAIRTVTWTPLRDWIRRGVKGHYVLMRLKRAPDAKAARALRAAALRFEGKPYDLLFNWSDEAVYCSELVWKAYDRGLGVTLVPLKTFRDYDLDHEEVRRIVKERFQIDIPWDEKAVAPADLMESDLLELADKQ